MNARNGKIARLSREIRDELNERLERSEPGPQLLAWLNALKEVKATLRDEFDGVPISKQNLSEWRQGGFQEWLTRKDLWARFRKVEDFAEDVSEDRDDVPADAVATVLAIRYGALISKWDGEADAKFEAEVRMLDRITRSVVRLQRSTHQAKEEKEEFLRKLEEDYQKQKEKIKNKRVDRMYSMLREPQVAEVFGGGELGRKIAKYIIQVENDIPGAKLELTNDEKNGKIAPNSVKPAPKKRTAKRARKTEATKMIKPLEENEMQGDEEAESSQDESSQVKPGQTDLEQPKEGGVGSRSGADETQQAHSETGGRSTDGM
jgi:hypothetical protein